MDSFLALAAVIINQSQDVSNLRSVADRLHTSVIEVRSSRNGGSPVWGTGVLVGGGLALTAFHNVGATAADGQVTAMPEITAIVYDHGEVRARVAAVAPKLDLAVLRLDPGETPEAAPLATEPPALGDRLVAMGASHEEIVAAGVTVSQEQDGGTLLLSSSRTIDARFWGGPVFDGGGHLTAMTLTSKGQVQAISIAALRPFIDQAAAVQ